MNTLIRTAGTLTGGGFGYIYSDYNKEYKYNLERTERGLSKQEIPPVIHVIPTLVGGTIGGFFPSIPFIGFSAFSLAFIMYKYSLWEKKIVESANKVKE